MPRLDSAAPNLAGAGAGLTGPLIPRVFIITLLAKGVSRKPTSLNGLRGEARGAPDHRLAESVKEGQTEAPASGQSTCGPTVPPDHCP